MRQRNHAASSLAYYQRPRYSMPIPAPVNYQIVPIRHANSFYRVPTRSLQSLNTFANNNGICRAILDDNNNNNSNNSRYGTLRNHTDERRSPYYYNELTRVHVQQSQQQQIPQQQQQQQFLPIPNHINNDDSFTDFINTIHHPETVS